MKYLTGGALAVGCGVILPIAVYALATSIVSWLVIISVLMLLFWRWERVMDDQETDDGIDPWWKDGEEEGR